MPTSHRSMTARHGLGNGKCTWCGTGDPPGTVRSSNPVPWVTEHSTVPLVTSVRRMKVNEIKAIKPIWQNFRTLHHITFNVFCTDFANSNKKQNKNPLISNVTNQTKPPLWMPVSSDCRVCLAACGLIAKVRVLCVEQPSQHRGFFKGLTGRSGRHYW